MWDFAGSTVVHSTGAWLALMGAIFLGPRIGKYTKDGKVNPIPGHSIPMAALGVFILWLGWFGFNPGSTMAADARHRPHRHDDQHGRRHRRHRRDGPLVAAVQEGRHQHDAQRRPGRPGGDHRPLRLRRAVVGGGHRPDRRPGWSSGRSSSSTRSASTTRSAPSRSTASAAPSGRSCSASSPRTASPPARPATACSSAAGPSLLIHQLIGVAAVFGFCVVGRRRSSSAASS